jgi:hypothetical protein
LTFNYAIFKNMVFLLGLILSGAMMNPAASENSYVFSGARWHDTRAHSVAAFANVDPRDGKLQANVIIQYDRNADFGWEVNFLVKRDDLLVFDGSLYKVSDINLDTVVRERIKHAIEQKMQLPPGSAEVRDQVTVEKITHDAFADGLIVLPSAPSVCRLSVNQDEELELIFDGAKASEGKALLASMRWRIYDLDDAIENGGSEVEFQHIVNAESGAAFDIPAVGKLEIIEIIPGTQHQQPWIVVRISRSN